jgi:hypothetical protein
LPGFVVRSALAQVEDRQLFEATARGRFRAAPASTCTRPRRRAARVTRW